MRGNRFLIDDPEVRYRFPCEGTFGLTLSGSYEMKFKATCDFILQPIVM